MGRAVRRALGPGRTPADEGSLVVGWFVKIAVVLGLVGVVGFDGIAIAQAHARVGDAADQVAQAAAGAYAAHQSVDEATRVATIEAHSVQSTLVPPVVAQPDGSVSVTVRITAKTTLLGHLPGTGTWPDVTVTATANPKKPGL
jgi:hypothetical protein